MSNYQRSTRECTPDQLRPELRQALNEYFTTHNLGDLDAENLLCCETTSIKNKNGWLSALLESWLGTVEAPVIYSAILLTAQTLVWARSGNGPTLATGANLMNIRARIFTSMLDRDSGLEVSGAIDDSKGLLRGYIGLGPEPASQKLCEEVIQAIQKVNPASTRKFPTWMGGR